MAESDKDVVKLTIAATGKEHAMRDAIAIAKTKIVNAEGGDDTAAAKLKQQEEVLDNELASGIAERNLSRDSFAILQARRELRDGKKAQATSASMQLLRAPDGVRPPMSLIVRNLRHPERLDAMLFQYVPNDFNIAISPSYSGGRAGGGAAEVLAYKGTTAKQIKFTLFLNDIGEPDFRRGLLQDREPFISPVGDTPFEDFRNQQVEQGQLRVRRGRSGHGSNKFKLKTNIAIDGLTDLADPNTGFGPGNVEHALRWLEDKATPFGDTGFTLEAVSRGIEGKSLGPPILTLTAGPWFRSFRGTITNAIDVVITSVSVSDVQMDKNFIRTQAKVSITLKEQIDVFGKTL